MKALTLVMLLGCAPLYALNPTLSARFQAETGLGLPVMRSAVELILPIEDSLDISVGVSSTPGSWSSGALACSFSHVAATYTTIWTSTFTRDLEGTLRLHLGADGSLDLTLSFDAAFKAPPVSHLLSGSLTYSPPFGGAWSVTGTLLQVFSQGSGCSFFAGLHGDFSRISYSGIPAEHQSLLRFGGRVTFADDSATHHGTLEITHGHTSGLMPSISYHVMLDIPTHSL